MTLKIQSLDNNDNLYQATFRRLHGILSKLNDVAPVVQDEIVKTVRAHFTSRFPGSRHYDPSKVQKGIAYNGTTPTTIVQIDVPGVGRAYHDVTILPKTRKHLSIPCHQAAYGKKVSDFPKSFVVENRNGNLFVAQNEGGVLVALFNLVDRAFQPRDPSIMPSEETMEKNIFARIGAYLDNLR